MHGVRTARRMLTAAMAALAIAAPAARAATVQAATVDAFGTAFKTWAATQKVGRGFVVVRRGGKVIYQMAIGGADPAQPVMLASLSKAITGTCIATLVRDGKLTFDTPLSVALAKFFAAHGKPADPRVPTITIAQLLEHRAGFVGPGSPTEPAGTAIQPYLAKHKASTPNIGDYLALAFQSKLAQDPGTSYEYSNTGYLTLGAVVEEVTGKPYATYCADAVLKPMGATGSLDPTWAMIGPFGGWDLSAENYLKFEDIFDPANETLGKAADAFLFSPTGKATSFDASTWYGLGTNVRAAAGGGYNTWHWGEWRYAIDAKGNPLTVNFNTFVTRAGDGTEWFAWYTPAVTSEAVRDQLDAALFAAYRAVTVWP